MIEEAEHMTTAILPDIPYRQWVFTLPFDLRYVLAWNADLRNAVHQALMRAINKHYRRDAEPGPVNKSETHFRKSLTGKVQLGHGHGRIDPRSIGRHLGDRLAVDKPLGMLCISS